MKWLCTLLLLSSMLSAAERVVCVHGFMNGRGNFAPLARYFEQKGLTVYNWGYPSRHARIEEHGAALVEELQRVAAAEPGVPIHFVTHSMGGLVLRTALNHPDCPAEAFQGRIVMIGPPNQGAILARRLRKVGVIRSIMGDRSGAQLGDALEAQLPEEMPVLVIAGTFGFNPLIPGLNDGKVAVAETRLDTPHQHETVWAGHSSISSAPRVIRRAHSFIADRADY